MRRAYGSVVASLWACGLWLAPAVSEGADRAASGTPPAPPATTVARPGESCALLAQRVYGDAPGSLAHLRAANPSLCDAPLAGGTVVQTPPRKGGKVRALSRAEAAQKEQPRLSFVGPAVRTQTRRGDWYEALPGQPVDRKMRIETSQSGGAEVRSGDKVRIQLDPNSKMVVGSLPRGRASGEVRLVEGSLRAGVKDEKQAGPLTVRTPAADVRLRGGGARIDAEGKDATSVSVYRGTATVRARGGEITLGAGQGTLILSSAGALAPHSLPTAPQWSGADPAAAARRPLLVVGLGGLEGPAPLGEVAVDFAPTPGAARYLVEIARDYEFNDHRAGGEIERPPYRARLQPGLYFARVSAIDTQHLIGPASPVRSFFIITLRSNASVAGAAAQPAQPGSPPPGSPPPPGVPAPSPAPADGVPLVLTRSLSAQLKVSGVGLPLSLRIDDGPSISCAQEQSVTLGPGEHRVALSLEGAQSELLVSVPAPPPQVRYARSESRVEPADLPVPLSTPGFPGRALQPRSRVYALIGFGAARPDQQVGIGRLDLGGEISLLGQRLGFDANLPLLYYSGLRDAEGGLRSGPGLGDATIGARGVVVSAFDGKLAFGPLLRLQLPTGTFPRAADAARPVVLDPALGLAGKLGPVGLLTTQGPTAILNLPVNQLRWSMSYTAEVQLWRLSLLAQLDAAVGLAGGADGGASLGGGARLHLGKWGVLLGARGGLGQSGQAVFGRYYAYAGAEWVYK